MCLNETRVQDKMIGVFAWTVLALLAAIAVFIHKLRQRKVAAGFKAVLITGCDHGFGNLLAKRLDGEGFKIFAGCLDVNSDGAQSLRGETSSKLELLQLDVTSDAQIVAAKKTVTDNLMGHMLWAVVNNAGIGDHTRFEWIPRVNFQKVIDVNFMGVVEVTRAFLPLVRAAKGRIINMASMAGRTALPGFTAYSSSKFAVIGFSESLRRELADFGVKVITVEPSLYNTGISNPDVISNTNENCWAQAEPGIKRDYGESYFKATQVGWKRVLAFGSDNISQVVDCYVHAVLARYPSNRYSPPLYLALLFNVLAVTASSFQDFVIRCVIGLSVKPEMVSARGERGLKPGRRRSCAS